MEHKGKNIALWKKVEHLETQTTYVWKRPTGLFGRKVKEIMQCVYVYSVCVCVCV